MTGSAVAADLPDIVFEEPVPLPEPSRFDWSGFYFGGHAGVMAGSVDPALPGKPIYENAFVGGAHVGVSAMLTPMFVIGLEGDIDMSNYDQTRDYGGNPVNGRIDWTGSARGRVGAAFGQFWIADNIQAYATAGVAFARIRAQTPGYTDAANHTGYTVGGGVEAAITKNVSARVEYLFTEYSNELYALGPSVGTVEMDARTNVVRGGISYYF
ncbi:porin family protein [Amorphus sp. 3PC139-8]